jgi:glycosyltransferase involved in cell wall biosynthesis
MFLSIVSPVYKAQGIIPELVRRVLAAVEAITQDYEIILVEDGSPDNSWQEMLQESAKDKRVKSVKLSRNFGQHYAITAGLDIAKGEWVVVMDCDLQDQPEEIGKLLLAARAGASIVLARRVLRTDGFFKKTGSKTFYTILGYLTGVKQDPAVANFGVYHQSVVKAIRQLREPIRYFPTMVRWVGFQKTYIDIEHGERFSGSTSYNWHKLFRLAIDIILANSDKPIRLIVKAGFMLSFGAFLFGLYSIWRYLSGQIIVPGYTSLLVSVWFLGGLLMSVLGIIGLYVGKIFEGVKNRPVYIVEKIVNE